MDGSGPGDGDDLVLRRLRTTISDVLADAGVQQIGGLVDERDVRAQVREADFAEIAAIQAHCATFGIVEADEQIGDGRFSDTAWAGDGADTAGGHTERNAVKHDIVTIVPEGNVVELDLAAH